ncbi:ribonuclease HI [Fluviicola taffensis]|uniref:ribonuclease H n=1 Tax=Fluviicola taffensis (strain DSM 16823 / NCIMB 13979 / RW262) TaxID=755732 RepID=F2I9S2_FLUTR|nr:ribonuclease HI [Fluviicola taffensis]AEA43068.1 RNase HI [Fluviicola taffensis DSM 16823]
MSAFIEIYTDGSSRGNPGPGGYGVILKYKSSLKELSQGFRLTTNNRMELIAVIIALESLKTTSIPIKVYSDSKYVIDSIQKRWVNSWQSKGFAKKKNKDLWMRYLKIEKQFQIEFIWVRGHNGHPENERCDILAVEAALGKNLIVDTYFEEVQQHED